LASKRPRALCDDRSASGKPAPPGAAPAPPPFYPAAAQRLRGGAERGANPQEKRAEALAKRAAADETALWPADQPILPAGSLEALDYETLARATVAGEPDDMMAAAPRLARSHSGSALSPGAPLVVSAAREPLRPLPP